MALKAKAITKLYYSVGEAADLLGEEVANLKYWEKEFPKYIKPRFSKGGTRSYTQEDIKTFRIIMRLRAEGISIDGIRRKLSAQHTLLEDKEAIIIRLEACLGKLQSIEAQLKPQAAEELD